MSMRRLRNDTGGLESLPLKLIIVAVVATMSVLPASQALSGLENREFARRAQIQLDLVVRTAQVLAVQGPGNVRTINLDFTTNGKLSFERITIGDRVGGANSSSCVLVLSNGARMIRVATDPGCIICSHSMLEFESTHAKFDLRMNAALDNRTILIVVGMV